MADFALIAGPLIAVLIKSKTGKDVDLPALEAAVSGLIDNIVAINKATHLFERDHPAPTT